MVIIIIIIIIIITMKKTLYKNFIKSYTQNFSKILLIRKRQYQYKIPAKPLPRNQIELLKKIKSKVPIMIIIIIIFLNN